MALVNRELCTLLDVHHFYMGVLHDTLHHEVPLPYGLERFQDTAGPDDVPEDEVEETLLLLRRWLNVMDLAITAPMVRDALKASTSYQAAASLLVYFINKVTHTNADRDKADFAVTFLYRNPLPAGAWEANGNVFSADASGGQFETTLLYLLDVRQAPRLPEQNNSLLRELNFIAQEVDEMQHFDALMDSGVMQRVRELKDSLGASFYHPHVLSVIAAYNVFFGSRFDKLFRAAARQIKTFAEKVQSEGGSMMSRVQGDVLVRELVNVEEDKILEAEYSRAQENFRKVSKLKKAVDTRRGDKATATKAAAATPIVAPDPLFTPSMSASGADPAVVVTADELAVPSSAAAGGALANNLEQTKLQAMADIIRNFLRASEAKGAQVVPLRHGSISLSQVECDAFRADYIQEKSFRADFANAIVQTISTIARLYLEAADYRQKQSSAYLWKPHADSLAFLLTVGQQYIENSQNLIALAEKRGLAEKAATLRMTTQRLQQELKNIAKLLQSVAVSSGD